MAHVKLSDLQIGGFATGNVYEGDVVSVLRRATLTSDHPEFYLYMKSITGVLTSFARKAGTAIFWDSVCSLLLVVHSDHSADLYVEHPPLKVEMLAKRSVAAGQVIGSRHIADIQRMQFDGISLREDDKVLVCFKVGWKFGLFFDLADNRVLPIDDMERELGTLYRMLLYGDVYETLRNEALFETLVDAGRFPFVEIIGDGFDALLHAYKTNFNIEGIEGKQVAQFDAKRIGELADRWWSHPLYAKRQTILGSGLEAFKRNDSVASLKTLLSEIEGIIREARIAETGQSTRSFKDLLKYAADAGVKKTGSEMSLLLPTYFLQYLQRYTFADFDPMVAASAPSRHSVTHGAAAETAYTQVRALQAILTLDQLRFYL